MDSKEAKESKEAKDTKETKTGKSSGNGIWFSIVIIIILIIVIVGLYVFYQNQNFLFQNKINGLEKNNSDLSNQVTGFSIKVDTLKNFSQNVKSGQVPFWQLNGEDVMVVQVPLNSYSARVFSQNIVAKYALDNNYTFKKVTKNMSIWTANFICSNVVNDSSCGAQVLIDERAKTYSYSFQ